NGTETPRWRDGEFLIAMNAREKLTIEVDRQGAGVFLEVVPRAESKYDIGDIGAYPSTPVQPKVDTVISGGPAERAGLKPGDVIVSVAGRPIRAYPQEVFQKFVGAVSAAAPGPFEIRYERKGKPGVAMIKPRKEGGAWKIDVRVASDLAEVVERFPLPQAFVEGWRRVETDFRTTLSVLGRLFRGRASIRTMSGPIDIAKFS